MRKNRFQTGIITGKILLLGYFASQYSKELFFPFVDTFVEGIFNPYQSHYQKGLDMFPYHALMLYILTPFVFFINLLGIKGFFITNLFFKTPLLLADICIFKILQKLIPNKKKEILIYYFLNPIILYSTYIHSQLDIIPMAFLMISIYFLVKDKIVFSALFLGLAISTKSHILITLPLIVFYIYRKGFLKNSIRYLFIALSTPVLLDLPFLSDGFMQMVLLNPKQQLIFDSYLSIGDLKILLPFMLIPLIYFHFLNQKKVNFDLMYFYIGILFMGLVFTVYPAPGWYTWIAPFITIYFCRQDTFKTKLLYVLFTLSYLSFFLLFYKGDYFDIVTSNGPLNLTIDSHKWKNISYTLLQVTLIAAMYAFYKWGYQSNQIYKRFLNVVIGISGDSASGKTKLAEGLSDLFGYKMLKLEGDGEHKWIRGDSNWAQYTHLDPKANHLYKQADYVKKLKAHETIYRSDYNHQDGAFTEAQKVKPREFIMLVGLHTFYLPKLRKEVDFKIYLDTDESLRTHWKILRDMKNRGYSREKVLDQIASRKNDAKKHIHPQKQFADLIIRLFPLKLIETGENETKLGIKLTLDAGIQIDHILEMLDTPFSWDYNEDLKTQYLLFETPPESDFKKIAEKNITNLYEILPHETVWKKGYEGLIQLVSLLAISEILKKS